MNPLTKCPSCTKHTNPITAQEYSWRAQSQNLPLLRPGTKPTDNVCEYCGWKMNKTK